MRRFLSDNIEDGGFTVTCQMDCLRQKLGVKCNVFRKYDYLTKDIDNIPAKDFINGSLRGIYKENGDREFPTYNKKIEPLFEQMKKKIGYK